VRILVLLVYCLLFGRCTHALRLTLEWRHQAALRANLDEKGTTKYSASLGGENMCKCSLGRALARWEVHVAGLKSSLKMLTDEVELSKGNLSLINNTTNKLTSTADEYSRQHGRLQKSRGLLRRIRFLDRKEDILLYVGIAIFSAAVMYVLIRRTLHFVPALPRLLPYRQTVPRAHHHMQRPHSTQPGGKAEADGWDRPEAEGQHKHVEL
jgi:hypothetical protein